MFNIDKYIEKNNIKADQLIIKQKSIIQHNQEKALILKKELNNSIISKQRNKIRGDLKLINNKNKKIKSSFNYKIGVLKNEVSLTEEQIKFVDNNLIKYNRTLTKSQERYDKNYSNVEESIKVLKNKAENSSIKSKMKIVRKNVKSFDNEIKHNTKQIDKLNKKLLKLNEFQNDINIDITLFKEDYGSIMNNSNEDENSKLLSDEFEELIKSKDKIDFEILNLEKNIDDMNKEIENISYLRDEKLESDNDVIKRMDLLINSKIIIEKHKLLTIDLKQNKKYVLKEEKEKQRKMVVLEIINMKIQKYLQLASNSIESIVSVENRTTRALNWVERLLLKDWFFIIISALLSTGVVLSTSLYLTTGVGAMNEIVYAQMLNTGMETGDFTAAMGFAAGFLIARVLEGPMTGILDIGGSILSGVGIGIPAVFLSSSKLSWLILNPMAALLVGLIAGLIIGIIIMVVRMLKPKETQGLGTDIMIGAGNATGKFMGPLVVISAAMFQPLVGIGAGIGAGVFMWMKKPMVGGAIIGAMLFGIVPAFF